MSHAVVDATRLVTVDDLSQVPDEALVLVYPEGGPEIRQSERGETFVMAYTGAEQLAECCGSGQPFVQLRRNQLKRLCDELKLVMIALDAPHPEGHRYPEPDLSAPAELPELESPPEVGDLLWVPSRPACRGDREVTMELHPDSEGRTCLAAFTSIEELTSGCGPHQAAVAIRADRVEPVALEAGAQLVLINPVLADEARHAVPIQDWTRTRRTERR